MQISDYTINLNGWHPCGGSLKLDMAGAYTMAELMDIIADKVCHGIDEKGLDKECYHCTIDKINERYAKQYQNRNNTYQYKVRRQNRVLLSFTRGHARTDAFNLNISIETTLDKIVKSKGATSFSIKGKIHPNYRDREIKNMSLPSVKIKLKKLDTSLTVEEFITSIGLYEETEKIIKAHEAEALAKHNKFYEGCLNSVKALLGKP